MLDLAGRAAIVIGGIPCLICVFCVIGCSQANESPDSTSASHQADAQDIAHGRVTLARYRIEESAPDESAVISGLDAATAQLNQRLETEEFAAANGTLAGRFRVDDTGHVYVFMTDETKTLFTNDDRIKDELEHIGFGVSAFRGLSFPELGEGTLIYAEFQIVPSQSSPGH